MKEYVTEQEFINRFAKMNRENNFSLKGRRALYAYFEEIEKDAKEDIEFDCIGICCDYTEYESLEAFQEEHNKQDYPSIKEVQDATIVIMVDEQRFIIQNF